LTATALELGGGYGGYGGYGDTLGFLIKLIYSNNENELFSYWKR